MKIDKEAITLFVLKFISYAINILIIVAILVAVGGFVYYLFLGGSSHFKKTKRVDATPAIMMPA